MTFRIDIITTLLLYLECFKLLKKNTTAILWLSSFIKDCERYPNYICVV